MDEKQIAAREKDLRRRIQHDGLTPVQALNALRDEYEDMGVGQATLEALQTAYARIEEKIRNIERLSIINSARMAPEPWYDGASEFDRRWSAYERYLMEKGWEDSIESIHQSSDQIVSLLHRPGLSSFSGRGLVLGYVQSGKTANMTAVIAKACDAGFHIVIVLTGMIEKLRQQTQKRLQKDLFDHEDTGNWHFWTTAEEDYRHQTSPGFQFNAADRNVFVLKKNAAILKRLLDRLENTSDIELQKCSVLVIDDECDQASVNASSKVTDWKAINRLIRQTLEKFRRCSYVGYTATPFANVLIDPAIDPERPEDLYPRDFIYSLDRPDAYFGAERLFGRDLLDADTEPAYDEELDMIRTVPGDEIMRLRPTGRDNSDQPVITESLLEAVQYYLLATAIRNLRGQRAEHCTMLIHTSQLVNDHSMLFLEVGRALEGIKSNVGRNQSKIRSDLSELFDRERAAVPPQLFGNPLHDFDEVWHELCASIDDVEIVVENSSPMTNRIDYDGAPEDSGRRYICIGGNVLARGLTLEGLVASFFIRTTTQYDTMMQMGRWFGYRQGYEDLQRIWMTLEMQDNFYSLATVEADIRRQIRNVYDNRENTPLDVAVRIRQIPGLAITAANKMLAAQRCNFSFAGRHIQTTRFFYKDAGVLASNYQAASDLIMRVASSTKNEDRDQGILFEGVDRAEVESFLNSYRIHESQLDLVSTDGRERHLLAYIGNCKRQDPEALRLWNVGIVQPQGSGVSHDLALGPLTDLKTINRSMLRELSSGGADIKALMSVTDIALDLGPGTPYDRSWDKIKEARREHANTDRPLLLLYLIDRNSRPGAVTKNAAGIARETVRKPLNAVEHVVGFGIVFPGTEGGDGATFEVQVRLPEEIDAEQLTEEQVEELM